MVIAFITAAALFYVAPGVLGSVKVSSPTVLATTDAALNASQTSISSAVSGGLSISSIALLMAGVATMIFGFMIFRQYQRA